MFDLFILGVYVSLTSVVLVDLLGLEVLTSSFGLTLLFTGVAAVVGPPVAGIMAKHGNCSFNTKILTCMHALLYFLQRPCTFFLYF